MGTLERERERYVGHCLASSTFRTYESGFNSYISFCSLAQFPLFPLVEEHLELFVCSLARRLAYDSIKVYLCSVQFFATMNGDRSKISSMSHLYYVLRGIRICIGSSRRRPLRRPITIPLLHRLWNHIHLSFCPHDASMLAAATSLAFFGLLRSSEFTSPSANKWSHDSLSFQDIKVINNILTVQIRGSKTDPFKFGSTIRIGPNSSKLCPVKAMEKYLSLSPLSVGPVFRFSDGTFLTRQFLSSILASCFPNGHINTHSFRIGAASTAASVGVPDSTIQILGRWSSNAFHRYLRFSNTSVAQLSQRMASSSSLGRTWNSSWLVSRVIP